MQVGPVSDRASDMGPLVTAQHLAKVAGYIDAGEAEGAKLVIDGRGFKAPQGYENGYFVGGTLFDDMTPDMTICKEEIFGPVADYAAAVARIWQRRRDLYPRPRRGADVCARH